MPDVTQEQMQAWLEEARNAYVEMHGPPRPTSTGAFGNGYVAAKRASALVWTAEPPTESGDWHYSDEPDSSVIVTVLDKRVWFPGRDNPIALGDLNGRWAGPIEMPLDPASPD